MVQLNREVLEMVDEMVAKREAEKKIVKLSKQHQIKKLMAEGIDKEMAKIMVESFMSCGLSF